MSHAGTHGADHADGGHGRHGVDGSPGSQGSVDAAGPAGDLTWPEWEAMSEDHRHRTWRALSGRERVELIHMAPPPDGGDGRLSSDFLSIPSDS